MESHLLPTTNGNYLWGRRWVDLLLKGQQRIKHTFRSSRRRRKKTLG